MSIDKYTNHGFIVIDGLKNRPRGVKEADGTISWVRPGEVSSLYRMDRVLTTRMLPRECPLGASEALDDRFLYVSFSNISVYSLLYMS
jgi:hypothetical protein